MAVTRVLGLRLSLAPVLRMAAPGEYHKKHMPEVPEAPPPKATGESEPEAAGGDPWDLATAAPSQPATRQEKPPPFHVTYHGHVHTPHEREDDSALPAARREAEQAAADPANEESLRRLSAHMASSAVMSGQDRQHIIGNGGASFLLHADPEGRVSAHYLTQEDMRWAYHPEGYFDWGHLGRRHKDVVAKDKAYATSKVHPDLPPLVKSLHDDDAAPALILSDWLEEHGHGELAHRIRVVTDNRGGYPPAPETVRKWLISPEKEHQDANQTLDGLRDKQGRLSLKFGPALPFRSRSYHPRPRPTDLKENEWGRIKRYFPEPEMGPRNRRTAVRVLMNSSLFRFENNLSLRDVDDVAPDYPPWGSRHAFEFRVSEAGLWPNILKAAGRGHLLERLPKLVRSARESAGGPLGRGPQRVNVAGLPTIEQ